MTSHILSFFISLNIFPADFAYIGLYDSNSNKVGIIERENVRRDKPTKLYTFGLLSDVHQTILASKAAEWESEQDLIHAIGYLTDKHVAFTVISGDLGLEYGSAAAELDKYANAIAQVPNHAPIYPTTGNHDCPTSGNVDIQRFKEKTGITSLFTDAATNSYEITKTSITESGKTMTDHFLFLGMNRYVFPSWYEKDAPYLDSDLDWLQDRLESYKNDRCFVITHLFFRNAAGNVQSIYTRHQDNWLRGAQLGRLLWIRDRYPRSIWFSGHSHWQWQSQSVESNATIDPTSNSNRSCSWAFHVPSCANPCVPKNDSKEQHGKESQGGFVDVYEDFIEIHGIEFKGEEDKSHYIDKYIPVGQYRIPFKPTGCPQTNVIAVTSSMVHANQSKSTPAYVVNDSTHDLTVTFTANAQGIAIYDGEPFRNDLRTMVLHDGIEWVDPVLPPSKSALEYIGFFVEGRAPDITTRYTFDSGADVDTSIGAVQLNSSSSYTGSGGIIPITFRIKNLRYVTIGK